jgi:hypothetical protein
LKKLTYHQAEKSEEQKLEEFNMARISDGVGICQCLKTNIYVELIPFRYTASIYSF